MTGSVADQQVGEDVEPLGGVGLPAGVGPGPLQEDDDPGDDEHDDDVDDQGDPVLGLADRERVVRRDEQHVVGHEAGDDGDETGRQAADGHPADDRDDEDEGARGDREVVPGRHHHRAEHADADQGDDDAGQRSSSPRKCTSGGKPGRMRACPTGPSMIDRSAVDDESRQAVRPDGQVPDLPRLGRRRRQDVRHARRGLAPPPPGRRRRRRVRRDARPAAHGRADPRPAGRPPPGRRLPRHGVRGDGPRRGARPAARGRPRRRARPHQRPGVRDPREAVGGRPRPARRRHRGHQHRQHPARREPGRRGRGDHRRARSASASPTGSSAGRTRSS